MGHLKKLRRYAGASIGAVTAALLALGHTAESLLVELKTAPKMEAFLGTNTSLKVINTFLGD